MGGFGMSLLMRNMMRPKGGADGSEQAPPVDVAGQQPLMQQPFGVAQPFRRPMPEPQRPRFGSGPVSEEI